MRDALTDFLDDAFLPALDAVTARARETYAELGVAPDEALPLRERVPSPSDFGFHNAVRAGDGMVFLDFEYFGWDDPAKLTADFLLHPGMDISWRSRMRFARGVVRVLGDAALAGRVDALLPLFGLKWCMILLNEFVRGDMERREFAGASEAKEAILERQLGKARAMLEIALGHAREGLDL